MVLVGTAGNAGLAGSVPGTLGSGERLGDGLEGVLCCATLVGTLVFEGLGGATGFGRDAGDVASCGCGAVCAAI